MKIVNLWSKRYSTARGWEWKIERICDETTAGRWLEIYQKDEPGIVFCLSTTKPKEVK